MKRSIFIGLALCLAGCDNIPSLGTEEKPVEAEKKAEEKVPEMNPVDKAMSEIAPGDRRNFQNALACKVKQNPEKGIEITPEFIRDLYADLKANPAIAEC